ncbi:MAG: RimK family alpha-L-glutamate ligase, partial [Vulcanimicrobiota bacterium]
MTAQIGILAGNEGPFPGDLIKRINEKNIDGIQAEMCQVEDVSIDDKIPYDVVVDRISHAIPFYKEYCKQAMLNGTYVINNPFRFFSDKFFGYSVAKQMGIPVPRTVALPTKSYRKGVTPDYLLNLVYPLDWEKIVNYIQFPAVLKPSAGYGWRDVTIVNNFDEFME